MIRNIVQHSENVRNSLGLNYKSAPVSGGAWAHNSQRHVHGPKRLFTFRQAEEGSVSSLLPASVFFGS
jgi:hypothetical protein